MIALVLLLGGCIATSVQTARTNGAGRPQLGLEPGAGGVALTGDVKDTVTSQGGRAAYVVPTFNIAVRMGVLNRLDIGGRLGTNLWELQTKIMLTHPDAVDSIAVSLAPSYRRFHIGASGNGNSGDFSYRNFPLPVLIGIPVGQGSEWVIGPRINPTVFRSTASVESIDAEGTVWFVSAGTSAGYAARLSDSFTLLPELGVEFPVYQSAAGNVEFLGASTSNTGGVGGYTFTFSLGCLLGGYRR